MNDKNEDKNKKQILHKIVHKASLFIVVYHGLVIVLTCFNVTQDIRVRCTNIKIYICHVSTCVGLV